LGNLVVGWRRAGLVPWTALRDDTDIQPALPQTWDDPEEFLRAYLPRPESFKPRLLDYQDWYIEVYCESGGMTHQLVRVAQPKGILVTGSGGFNSITGKWQLIKRIRQESRSRKVVILHLGDADLDGEGIFEALQKEVYIIRAQETMDPDHWQAVRDLHYGEAHTKHAIKSAKSAEFVEWLELFDDDDDSGPPCWQHKVVLDRVAVTDKQIDHYNLPEAERNPDKGGKHGRKPTLARHAVEVQLEAMNPSDIRTELGIAIARYWDPSDENLALAHAGEKREVIGHVRSEFELALDLRFGDHINDAE